MKTYLVTGGAGFIGSNFVIYMLNKYKDIKIIIEIPFIFIIAIAPLVIL